MNKIRRKDKSYIQPVCNIRYIYEYEVYHMHIKIKNRLLSDENLKIHKIVAHNDDIHGSFDLFQMLPLNCGTYTDDEILDGRLFHKWAP